jgi:hypothetical protein
MKLSVSDLSFQACCFLFLAVAGAAVAYPLIYVISCSFSSPSAIAIGKVVLWPVDFSISSYRAILNHPLLKSGFFNSLFYVAGGTIMAVSLILLCAYPLSRRDLPDRKFFLAQELQMPLNSLWYINNAMVLYTERRMGEQAEGMDIINRWLTTGDPSTRDRAFSSASFLLGGLIYWCNQDVQNALPDDYFIPPAVFNDADSKRVSDIKAILDPYLQQSIAEFVTGVRDINSDAAWNAYLADLDRLGSRERADLYQKYLR